MDWNGGMVNGTDYGIFKNNTQNTFLWHYPALLCGYSLTNLIASYWPAFIHPPRSLRGQRSHAYFDELQQTLLATWRLFRGLTEWKGINEARTQCKMVLSAVDTNSIVHSVVHSTIPVLIPVQ